MAPHTEKGDKELGVPPTTSEMDAVVPPRKRSGEGKGGMKKRVVDGSALDGDEQAHPPAWDNVEKGAAKMNWMQMDWLNYIGLGNYLDAECFDVLSVKGCEFCTNTKVLIRLATHCAIN